MNDRILIIWVKGGSLGQERDILSFNELYVFRSSLKNKVEYPTTLKRETEEENRDWTRDNPDLQQVLARENS